MVLTPIRILTRSWREILIIAIPHSFVLITSVISLQGAERKQQRSVSENKISLRFYIVLLQLFHQRGTAHLQQVGGMGHYPVGLLKRLLNQVYFQISQVLL